MYETKQDRRHREDRLLAEGARQCQRFGRLREAGLCLALITNAPIYAQPLREAGRRSDVSYEFVAGDAKTARKTTPEELEEQGPKLDKKGRRELRKRFLKGLKKADKLMTGKRSSADMMDGGGGVDVSESAGGNLLAVMGIERGSDGRVMGPDAPPELLRNLRETAAVQSGRAIRGPQPRGNLLAGVVGVREASVFAEMQAERRRGW